MCMHGQIYPLLQRGKGAMKEEICAMRLVEFLASHWNIISMEAVVTFYSHVHQCSSRVSVVEIHGVGSVNRKRIHHYFY
jgi:hypothetical protein